MPQAIAPTIATSAQTAISLGLIFRLGAEVPLGAVVVLATVCDLRSHVGPCV
ncbi:hypothetical protein SACE_1516 [Saccharopolyspora erythraea NRRL 2338]|uniref:Uncharacterized protein n=2 Tax=Saccharopolyspora erythraea TaxID=1836 RepID=A4F9W3_SACEN|nr:hypothetical protein SACE_1516 [Saccharopolyspora erythraea NRRL 2338]